MGLNIRINSTCNIQIKSSIAIVLSEAFRIRGRCVKLQIGIKIGILDTPNLEPPHVLSIPNKPSLQFHSVPIIVQPVVLRVVQIGLIDCVRFHDRVVTVKVRIKHKRSRQRVLPYEGLCWLHVASDYIVGCRKGRVRRVIREFVPGQGVNVRLVVPGYHYYFGHVVREMLSLLDFEDCGVSAFIVIDVELVFNMS